MRSRHGAQRRFQIVDYPLAAETRLTGINDESSAAGVYTDSEGNRHVFIYDGSSFNAVERAGYDILEISAINDSNLAVGSYYNKEGLQRGFSLDGAALTELNVDLPDSDQVIPLGVNNNGLIVGITDGPGASDFGNFIYDGSSYTRISYPGADNTFLCGVNDNGKMVGFFSEEGRWQAFIYDGSGKWEKISAPYSIVEGVGINNKNVVSGFFYDNDGKIHGFVYDDGRFDVVDAPNSVNTFVNRVNDKGQVCGWYEDASGGVHGFIATPVPTPSAALLLLLPE